MDADRAKRGSERSRERRITYCLLPPHLAPQLHDLLRDHFGGEPGIEVVVERRRRERRSGEDRRRGGRDAPVETERRRIKSASGRRAGERRATLVPLDAPPSLPGPAQPHGDEISFVERLEPSTREAEDRDAARLVARFQAGDREAFATLYTRYYNRVYGYLRTMVDDRHEAEDGVQQVFLNVLGALPDYERRDRPFRAWFNTVARNVALDQLRRRARIEVLDAALIERRLEQAGRLEHGPEGLDWISDRDLLDRVERLSLPQRQALLLHHMLGLSSAEAARVLGRTPEAVRGLQYRARRSLRDAAGAGA